MLRVENKSSVFIFSFLFTGENGKKSYETCLAIMQERKNWKIKNWHWFPIFVIELKIKWTNDPRTFSAFNMAGRKGPCSFPRQFLGASFRKEAGSSTLELFSV